MWLLLEGPLNTLPTVFGRNDGKSQYLHLPCEDFKHIRMIFYNEDFFHLDPCLNNFHGTNPLVSYAYDVPSGEILIFQRITHWG